MHGRKIAQGVRADIPVVQAKFGEVYGVTSVPVL